MSADIEFRWTSRADACGWCVDFLRSVPAFPARRPHGPHALNRRRVAAARLLATLAGEEHGPALADLLLDRCEEARVREAAIEGLARLEVSLAPGDLAALFGDWVAEAQRAEDPWLPREYDFRRPHGFMHWRLRRLLRTEPDRAAAAPLLETLRVDRARFEARAEEEPRAWAAAPARRLLTRRLGVAPDALDLGAIVASTSSGDAVARYLAIEAGEDALEALPGDAAWLAALETLARDPDTLVRTRVLAAWARRGDARMVAALRRLARDAARPLIRGEALRGLASVSPAAHVPLFCEALRDREWTGEGRPAREEALRGLGRAGTMEALTALVRDALERGACARLLHATSLAAATLEGGAPPPEHGLWSLRDHLCALDRPPHPNPPRYVDPDWLEADPLPVERPDDDGQARASFDTLRWTTREDVCAQLGRFIEAEKRGEYLRPARRDEAPCPGAAASLLRSLATRPEPPVGPPLAPTEHIVPLPAPEDMAAAVARWRDPDARAAIRAHLDRVDVRVLWCSLRDVDGGDLEEWAALLEGHEAKLAEAAESLLLPARMLLERLGGARLLEIIEEHIRDADAALAGGLDLLSLERDPGLALIEALVREHFERDRPRLLRSLRSAALADHVYASLAPEAWAHDRHAAIGEARRRLAAFPSDDDARRTYVRTLESALEGPEHGDRPLFLEALALEDFPGARFFAIDGVEALGVAPLEWRRRLDALARGGHPMLHVRAVAAFARTGDPTRVEELRALATGGEHIVVRAEALRRLADLDARAHVDLAMRALREDRAELRWCGCPDRPAVEEAIDLLGRAGTAEALTALLREFVRGHPDACFRGFETGLGRVRRHLVRAAWPDAHVVADPRAERRRWRWNGLGPYPPSQEDGAEWGR